MQVSERLRPIDKPARRFRMGIFSHFSMAQALTFSQLIDSSYKITKPLLKTYIIGALALMIISLILRGIASGLFSVAELPGIENNLIVLITTFLLGVVFAIVGTVFQILQTMYALIIAVDRTKDVKAGVRKTWKSLWKLVLGGMWLMVRSYSWISFFGLPLIVIGLRGNYDMLTILGSLILLVGIGFGIYLFPRLAFTNIVQLKDATGVRASANLSIQRTQGYWGKILGNNILVGLCVGLLTLAIVAVCALIGFMMITIVESIPPVIALIIGLPLGLALAIAAVIYFFAMTLFMRVYMVELYETIKANPRGKKA